MKLHQKKHVGVIGTGFIAKGLLLAMQYDPNLQISKVLTRRNFSELKDLPVKKSQLTHDINQVIKNSDIIVEATGDVIYATELVEHVLLAGLPVVTMNAELQLTTGSMLAKLGQLIEAEGDQPGTLAALDNEVRSMGFRPLVFGNIKGFLNHTPSEDEMKYWAKRQGIRLDKVTAFTDGTKVEIEQALVGNGLGATIHDHGMQAIECNSYEDGAQQLGELALNNQTILTDYVVSRGAPAGVFIVATHDNSQLPYLEYLKLGSGPLYTIIKPYHLCHLEISKTIRHVLTHSDDYTFNNSLNPQLQVVSLAKTDLQPGDKIKHGIGSFKVRGRAVKISENINAVPIGLLDGAVIEKPIHQGDIIQMDQVSLPVTRARELWEAYLFENFARSNQSVRRPTNNAVPIRRKPRGTWYKFLKQSNLPQKISSIEV